MVLILIAQGQGFIDTRKIWGILSLDKSHRPDDINEACRQAIELESYSYRTVKSLLRLGVSAKDQTLCLDKQRVDGLVPPQNKNAENVDNKFIHSLSEYKKQLELFH